MGSEVQRLQGEATRRTVAHAPTTETTRPRTARPPSPVASRMLHLQRQAGNRAVAGLVRSVQREPTANATADTMPAGAKAVDDIGLIDNDGKGGAKAGEPGVNLRAVPTDKGNAPLARLPHNQQVYVKHEAPGDWFKVATTDGQEGYVSKVYVRMSKDMPDPGSKLHRVADGETAFDIVNRHYGSDAMVAGSDARFYSNALIYANERFGKRGVREPTADEKKSLVAGHGFGKYLGAWTIAGAQIWLPSKEFADSLKGKVSAGSALRDAWESTKDWIVSAAQTAAFIPGLFVGALASLWDTVKGLYDLIKGILTGSIVDDVKTLIKAIGDKEMREAMLDGLANDLQEKWENPNPLKKWYWRGWIVGYLTGEVLQIVLLAGAGAAIKSTKYGMKAVQLGSKAMTAFKALGPVRKAIGLATKVAASKPVKAVLDTASKANKLKKQAGSLFSKPFREMRRKAGAYAAARAAAKWSKRIAVLAAKYGIPKNRLTKFLEMAMKHDLRIFLRKGNKASLRHLAEGAIPKPELIKSKTIQDIDLLLNPNLTKADVGLVGYFDPKMPPVRPPKMSSSDWKKLQKRYAERALDFSDNAPVMDKLKLSFKDKGRAHEKALGEFQVKLDRGVVQSIDPETGKISNIAGDTDVLQITDGGSTVLGGEHGSKIDDLLLEADLSEHGPHLWWMPKSAADYRIDLGVLKGHITGDVLEVSAKGLREVAGKDVPGFSQRLAAALARSKDL